MPTSFFQEEAIISKMANKPFTVKIKKTMHTPLYDDNTLVFSSFLYINVNYTATNEIVLHPSTYEPDIMSLNALCVFKSLKRHFGLSNPVTLACSTTYENIPKLIELHAIKGTRTPSQISRLLQCVPNNLKTFFLH